MLTSSLRRSCLLGGLLLALVVAAYGGTYGLSFASEDFILLGRLARTPILDTVLLEAAGPWLGLGHVNFYRPVAMALLAGETALLGLSPFAFHLAHVLLHGVNTVLVLWITSLLVGASGGGKAAGSTMRLPMAVAVLFALYPLHPSAVLFVGSFATVWGATFQLLALGWFLRWSTTGKTGFLAASLASFCLALGSYEAAAVLPAVLVTGGLALGACEPSPRERSAAVRRSLLSLLPVAGLLAGYLLLRRAALGVVLGGYPSFRSRLLERAGELVVDFLVSLPRLLLPDMERAPGRSLLAIAGACILVLGAMLFLRHTTFKHRDPRSWLVLLGLVWAAFFQLPFSFVGVVPANGRFWYLPSFAMALALCVGLELAARPAGDPPEGEGGAPGFFRRQAWILPVLCLAVVYLILLRRDLGAYHDADRQVRGVQQATLDAPSTYPLLIAGLPEFTTNGRGLPVAKVFQFGLHDALLPPFLEATTDALPVPAFIARDRLLPLARALGGRPLVWDPQSRQLHFPAPKRSPEVAIAAQRQEGRITYQCSECASVRVFAVTRGGAFRGETVMASAGALELPDAFLRGMGGLYGGPVLWWLEAERGGSGERVVSEIHRIEMADLFPGLRLRFGGGPAG